MNKLAGYFIYPTACAIGIFGLSFAGCIKSEQYSGQEGKGRADSAVHISYQKKGPPPQEIDPSILANRTFKEAPMLAAKVAAGELPPVSQRLPENPMVIIPVDSIGTYGGTLQQIIESDINEESTIRKTLSENLMQYAKPVPTQLQINLAQSYEFEDEGRSVIFKIRKGVKWSDGAPFTVDDILFWYEDMTLNEKARYAPLFPSRWTSRGKPLGMEKIDDHTLRIFADEPLGMVLRTLSFDHLAIPKHIFSEHHPRYNPKADYQSFRSMTSDGQLAYEPGIPRLSAWVPVEWVHGQKAVYERNPYYWKVDTEGNQLPYADWHEFTILRNPDIAFLKLINGEIDLYSKSLTDPSKYSLLKIEENKGGLITNKTASRLNVAFYFNWDVPNVSLRQAFRNRSVRIALSHAINRSEISEFQFQGHLEPVGYSFSPSSPWYSAEQSKLHSQYDPQKSRQLLDEAGYMDRDGDGVRELRDGTPFSLILDVFNEHKSTMDLCELVEEYWEAVGVDVVLNYGLQEILIPRRINGTFEVNLTDPPIDPMIQGNHIGYLGPFLPFWHRNAATDGPDWLHEVTALIRKGENTLDEEILSRYMIEVREIMTRELPFISIGHQSSIWAANARIGNIPEIVETEMHYRGFDRSVFPEQLYIKSIER